MLLETVGGSDVGAGDPADVADDSRRPSLAGIAILPPQFDQLRLAPFSGLVVAEHAHLVA